MSLKESYLIEEHRRLSARFIPFHGWKLPLEYSNAKTEHLAVRNTAGLFDVSQMGEIRVTGSSALKTLEYLLSNNIGKLQNNQAQYNLLCNPEGGIIDDLIVYCLKYGEDYLLCVNASRCSTDFTWIQKNNLFKDTSIQDESDQWVQLALQGPKAIDILSMVLSNNSKVEILNMKKFQFNWLPFNKEKIMVSATGYTGERGFEILVSPKQSVELWQQILNQGGQWGCVPVGLAARDTLRMEMKYPLYGNDLDEKTNPYCMGLSWAVKNSKKFIGSEALSKKQGAIQQKWVGFQLLNNNKGIPRKNYSVFLKDNKFLGKVTSGALSPCLNEVIGMALIDKQFANEGQLIYIQIHGDLIPTKIVATPFIKKHIPEGGNNDRRNT